MKSTTACPSQSHRPSAPISPPHADSLIAGLRAGDEHAYRELIRRFQKRLYPVAARIVNDEDEAKDVLQEAYIRIFKSIRGFRGESGLGTWIYRIVVNAALMRIRSRRRLVRLDSIPQETLERSLRNSHRAVGEDAERGLLRTECINRVRGFIGHLPENSRRVLELRLLKEKDTRETAALLGVTPNAAKIRFMRARRELVGLLSPGDERRLSYPRPHPACPPIRNSSADADLRTPN